MEIVIVSCHLMLFGTYIYHISNSTELKGSSRIYNCWLALLSDKGWFL